MRITDDRLADLVDVFVWGDASTTDAPAILLALLELEERRDDEYGEDDAALSPDDYIDDDDIPS
jgi:hypothetical protein